MDENFTNYKMKEAICDSLHEEIIEVDQYDFFKIFYTCKLLEQFTYV
jgi:hypothetical protein